MSKLDDSYYYIPFNIEDQEHLQEEDVEADKKYTNYYKISLEHIHERINELNRDYFSNCNPHSYAAFKNKYPNEYKEYIDLLYLAQNHASPDEEKEIKNELYNLKVKKNQDRKDRKRYWQSLDL